MQSRSSHFPWATLIIACVIIVIATFSYRAFLKTGHTAKQAFDKTADTISTIAKQIPDAAEKFKTGTITHTFIEHIPEVSSTNGDVLELTTSRSDEIFSRSDSKKIAWDTIYLGTTVSEIRVPATFRYHIRLSDPWRLAAKDKVCIVLAPAIRPSLPTAIDTSQMLFPALINALKQNHS